MTSQNFDSFLTTKSVVKKKLRSVITLFLSLTYISFYCAKQFGENFRKTFTLQFAKHTYLETSIQQENKRNDYIKICLVEIRGNISVDLSDEGLVGLQSFISRRKRQALFGKKRQQIKLVFGKFTYYNLETLLLMHSLEEIFL